MTKLTTSLLNKIPVLRLIFMGLALWVGVSTFGVAARAAEAPSVPIETVYFVGGHLVQSAPASDIWTEYDFKGTKRYTFETKAYNKNTLRLKGQTLKNQSGRVELLIDLKAKTISGEWPGHSMAQLYRITKVESFAEKSKDKNGNPVQEVTPPNYIPPGKKTPPVLETPTPPTPPSPDTSAPKTLTPATLQRATYEGGYFEKKDGKNWVEKTQQGETYSYQHLGYDDQSVFLYDSERGVFIALNAAKSRARTAQSGEALKTYAPLIELSASAAPQQPGTNPPENETESQIPRSDTKLSAVDRAVCLSKGGFVERAGLLGAERCTLRYSDGGNICIDSSNCQGKCLTEVNAKDVVSGQCQKTDNPFGCHSEVLGGKVQPGLCVD